MSESRNVRLPYVRRVTINRVRRSILFQPLAALLAFLILPLRVGASGNGGHFRELGAGGQTIVGCAPLGGTAIVQLYCGAGNFPTAYADLVQLESDSVSGYLGLHNIPQTNSSVIYQYGRSDLRSAVRGMMLANLLAIIQKNANDRTAHEQALYTWLQGIVQQNEIKFYSEALADYQSFANDPCDFQLDPTIAAAQNLSYNGAPFCSSEFTSLFSSPPVPAESYFLTYGLRKSYGAIGDQYSYAGAVTADAQLNVGEVAGISSAVGAVLLAGATAGLATLLTSIVAGGLYSCYLATTILSAPSIAAVGGVAAAAGGPFLVVLIALLIGITAGIQAFNNQTNLNNIANIATSYAAAQATPPDLETFVKDSTGEGLYKIDMSFVGQTLPEEASTAALPQHQNGIDANFQLQYQTGGPQFSEMFTYEDWKGTVWSAQTWGGWIVQRCLHDVNVQTCAQADSISGSIRYVDWSGTKWSGARSGNIFVSSKATPAPADQSCPANQTTGLSTSSNVSACSSYVSSSIPLLDGSGNKVTVSISPYQAPAFTGSSVLTFSPGLPSTQTITATGNPTPSICLSAGSLPSPADFNAQHCSNAPWTISFNGAKGITAGDYALTFSATNSAGSATESVSAHVGTDVKIISPATLSATYNQAVNFTVVAAGNPTPALTIDPGVNLDGLTFHDNGNGTATISGTAGPRTFLTGCTGDCPGIHASNGLTSDFQVFIVEVGSPGNASATGPFSTTFYAGTNNTFTLESTGATTPVSWSSSSAPASWLKFTNNADGSATITGFPPVGTTGSFQWPIGVTAAGSQNTYGNTYTINVSNAPVFTSVNSVDFYVGSPAGTTYALVSANEGTISLNSMLPTGILAGPIGDAFATGDAFQLTALGGSPPTGTGGQYELQFTDTDAYGTASKQLTLNIFEGPTVTSPALVTMFAGQPASFNVNTTGYPALATVPGAASSAPTSPAQGLGMYFTTSGLPASLSASNLNAAGFATGSLSVEGTPGSGDVGTHKVQITATNGVGSAAQQNLSLVVYPYAPTTAVNLLTGSAFARQSNNNQIATVVISNAGSSAATNVKITSAKLDSVAGIVLPPASVASIAPASSATFSVVFEAGTFPTAAVHAFSLAGSYTGGSFSSAARVVLP
jgi:hypothetical protein